MTASNPFGHSIVADDILEALSFFDTWEERYKYIIDLGRELPAMPPELKTDEHLVRGCQSQVWINSHPEGEALQFDADSDAFIVKGLLAVVLAAVNNQPPAAITAFDMDDYFDKLGLIRHLSSTRGNGLKAMVARIKATAAAA